MAKGDGHDCFDAGFERRYGDELLRANWNPVIALLQRDRPLEAARRAPAVSDEEAAAFLDRVYNAGT
jgi:hypothetical protein